jgi:hypothetical protein
MPHGAHPVIRQVDLVNLLSNSGLKFVVPRNARPVDKSVSRHYLPFECGSPHRLRRNAHVGRRPGTTPGQLVGTPGAGLCTTCGEQTWGNPILVPVIYI